MGRINPYLQIARFDHWFKNVFIIPGAIIALYFDRQFFTPDTFIRLLGILLATGFIASSNYVINEVLDAEHDKKHPVKRHRPVPSGVIYIPLAYAEWIILATIGLAMAYFLGPRIFIVGLFLWIMGCVYNIPPIRSKEKPYLDVLSESVNNPIRFLMGWYGTGTVLTPPLSILIAYWMIGAFLMTVKRVAEYKRINHRETAITYRKSFAYYTEERLLGAIIFYVSMFAFFLGMFLIRYRIELILSTPLFAGFVVLYLKMGFQYNSPTQYPEKLYKERGLMAYLGLCVIFVLMLFFIDIPDFTPVVPKNSCLILV